MPRTRPLVLVVDDDEYFASFVSDVLTDRGGYQVAQARKVEDALELARQKSFRIVIIDLKMPPGALFGMIATAGGHYTGIALAREVRKLLPNARIIVHSSQGDVDLKALPTPGKGVTYQYKMRDPDEFLRTVRQVATGQPEKPTAFIVHGHDHRLALELKNYLQNRLGFSEPTILAEQPNRGQTIIEKLEHYADRSGAAFVLLTPDDTGYRAAAKREGQQRARQNVIFEFGYFLGLMNRRSGRVVVLHKGPLEIPSDLAGVAYIDVSHGIAAAGELIRKEVEAWT